MILNADDVSTIDSVICVFSDSDLRAGVFSAGVSDASVC